MSGLFASYIWNTLFVDVSNTLGSGITPPPTPGPESLDFSTADNSQYVTGLSSIGVGVN